MERLHAKTLSSESESTEPIPKPFHFTKNFLIGILPGHLNKDFKEVPMERLSASSPSFYDPYADLPRSPRYQRFEDEISMSPLNLDSPAGSAQHPTLVEALTLLCEKAKETPAHIKYQSQYGVMILYAISENSGGYHYPFLCKWRTGDLPALRTRRDHPWLERSRLLHL